MICCEGLYIYENFNFYITEKIEGEDVEKRDQWWVV